MRRPPNVKAALAADLMELWPIPESSIRTLVEPQRAQVHEGVPPLRRCYLYGGLEG
jgi:hypothetical protein